MQIETYEVERESTEMGQLAADGEALLLVEKLGLTGQKKTFNADGTHLPYRPITKQENAVYSIMFPKKTPVEEFSDGPIPVRVLQVIAHCRELNLPDLKYIEVWHAESAKEDPVLVARNSRWSGVTYLLARWGDALLSLEELTEKAVSRSITTAKAKLTTAAQEIRIALECVEDKVRASISEGDVYNPFANV